MGTAQSSQATGSAGGTDSAALRVAVDRIATKFILTKDFTRVKDLTTDGACSELVVMTSDLIAKYLDDATIEYMTQHLGSDGQVTDKTTQERLLFFNRTAAQGESPAMGVQDRTRKTRMCVGIAQFYVRIFNLFAAITTTVNPQLAWTDKSTGRRKVVSMLDKASIPAGADARPTSSTICGSRISALFGTDVSGANSAPGVITIRPGICSLNEKSGNVHPSLYDEPGMPELAQLYNDRYNYSTGKFDKRSSAAEAAYLADVQAMYKVFMGVTTANPAIRSFKDILLRQYWRDPLCDKRAEPQKKPTAPGGAGSVQINLPLPTGLLLQQSQMGGASAPGVGAYRQTYTGSSKVAVYANYAKHIASMMTEAAAAEDELLGVLRQVFIGGTDTSGGYVTINPALTHDTLDAIIIDTRAKISRLYAGCELNFQKGIQLLEAVVEYQFAETAQNRTKDLKKQLDSLGMR
jgi:hypothetical protein